MDIELTNLDKFKDFLAKHVKPELLKNGYNRFINELIFNTYRNQVPVFTLEAKDTISGKPEHIYIKDFNVTYDEEIDEDLITIIF